MKNTFFLSLIVLVSIAGIFTVPETTFAQTPSNNSLISFVSFICPWTRVIPQFQIIFGSFCLSGFSPMEFVFNTISSYYAGITRYGAARVQNYSLWSKSFIIEAGTPQYFGGPNLPPNTFIPEHMVEIHPYPSHPPSCGSFSSTERCFNRVEETVGPGGALFLDFRVWPGLPVDFGNPPENCPWCYAPPGLYEVPIKVVITGGGLEARTETKFSVFVYLGTVLR